MKGMGLILIVAGALAVGVPGRAAGPTTRGATTAPARHTGPATMPTRKKEATTAPARRHVAGARKGAHAEKETPTSRPSAALDEWPAAEAFIKEHSPQRWQALESLGPDSEARRKIQRYIIGRYDALMDQKKKDAAMYKLQVRELEAEDRIFGLVSDRRRRRDGEDEFQARLRKATENLVDTRLDIRKLRITRLEKAIDQAKTRLEKDQQHRDELVEREMRMATKHSFSSRRGGHEGPPPKRPTTRRAATQPAD